MAQQLVRGLRAFNAGHRYLVTDGKRTVQVYARTTKIGHKFIQTYVDNVYSDKLLALPETGGMLMFVRTL